MLKEMEGITDETKWTLLMQTKKNESDLYKTALKKLDYGTIRKCVRDELIEANGKLNEAIQNYFKHHIIINSVLHFLNSEKTTKADTFGKQTCKEKNVSSHPLYLNLIKYAISEQTNDVNLFGINEEYINKTLAVRQKSELEKDELNKYVEKSIYDMCYNLMECSGYDCRNKKLWKRTFNQCIADLSSEVEQIAVMEKEISSNKIEIDDLLLKYYEELKQGLSMLKRLLHLFEKKVNFEVSLNALYAKRYSTLSWKIKLFDFEVLKATYTRKTNLALKKINEQLDIRDAKVKELLTVTNADIQVYFSLGAEYEALVKEYTDITNSITELQWSVNSLKDKYSHCERKKSGETV